MDKKYFMLKPYLYFVREAAFCNAIAQIRTSLHTLAFERGCHTRPKTPVQDRLCTSRNLIEDEAHYILSCQLHQNIMIDLFKNIEIFVASVEIWLKRNVSDIYATMKTGEYWHGSNGFFFIIDW